jgi:urease accessory protein UreH
VKRVSGPANDLIVETVAVMWTKTRVTMIRMVSKGEEALENLLMHLEETIEACQERGVSTSGWRMGK